MLVTSKTSKVNRVAPWLRITLFFQFSLPSKFCIAKYVTLRVVIWFSRLSDTLLKAVPSHYACKIFRMLNTKPSKAR